jgi:hypothetical protein
MVDVTLSPTLYLPTVFFYLPQPKTLTLYKHHSANTPRPSHRDNAQTRPDAFDPPQSINHRAKRVAVNAVKQKIM